MSVESLYSKLIDAVESELDDDSLSTAAVLGSLLLVGHELLNRFDNYLDTEDDLGSPE
jgi:hypothetical protein